MPAVTSIAGQTGNIGSTADPLVAPVVPLTTPSVQDVIDALIELGLVTQSD
jgi:hypothetical protein